ncbi:MAG TPA: hypothetical protein VKB39_02740 [Candidatus Baltobacteraceae bacterium]|nr:hypothetical protein [Candidatus Baltobacteraceae bacterium]
MRATVWAPLAAFAIMGIAASSAGAATTAKTATSATPTPNPKNDPCGATKSKWEHLRCVQYNGSAPGDEYFGRMKMSYLGIDNTYKDGVISAGAYTTDARLISKLMFANDALQAWEKKYPDDPQLARSYFFGEAVWRKVYTPDGQHIAWQYIQTLVHKYGNTYFGKTMKASLAKNGFTEHWFALPQMCPTPLPKGVTPETTPSATATPSPAPGQPSINIITPPCVQPSPSASPYAYPSGSASPSPSAGSTKSTPSPSPSPSPTPVAYPSGYKSPGALPELTPSPSPSPSKHP